jgi:hypothetical protein
MDIQLIEYFGVALKENEVLSRDKHNELLKLAAKTGYIIHPDCCNASVLKWLRTKDVNMNSTFYKTWDDVTKRNRFQLYIDQIVSYAINYGMGGNFNMNDGDYSLVPDIRKYKVILPITHDELFVKCRDVLYSGIALKDATSSALCGFVCKHYNEAVCLGLFSIDFVKNKEAQVKICDTLKIVPNDKFNLLRYMVYKTTGSAVLIKDKATIYKIEKHVGGSAFDMSKLSKENIEDLSSIFYRFKPIFLAFKKQMTKNHAVVNKIRKLAKVNHRPLTTGFWESVVNHPVSLEMLKTVLETTPPSNFKLITVIQSIRENRLLFGAQSRYKMYIIRNGKVWVDQLADPNVIDTKYDWWDILEEVLYKTLVERMKEKACTVKFPTDLNLTCPTSEKNFVGNIPFGSNYNMTEHNMVSVYWKNIWGTNDFDLSFVDYNGNKIGWNSDFYNSKRNVIYSGDMTNADPEAAEVIYFKKGCPNGMIKINRYWGEPNSKFIFSVAQNEVSTLPHNYMVDPNTIKFQTEVVSGTKMEQMLGFVNDNRLYICTFDTNNARVSGASTMAKDEDIAEILNRKCRSFVDLKKLLLDAGFKERKRGTKENPIELDLTDLKKDTLIDLFA